MNRKILRLAIPNIISNVSVPLLSTVDTVLMGQLSGLHLGAVGIGSMIFNFLYWNFVFLRMGTTGLTAQSYGKEDDKEMIITLGRALVTGLSIGLVLILIHGPAFEIAASLMNVSPAHYDLVRQYFIIRMFAAPATLGLYALMGWFFGMQNAIFPLIITLFLNAVNIALSAILVMHYGWEVKGVAYGTLIAQYLGLFLGLFLLFWKYRSMFQHLKLKAIFIQRELLAFFTLNKDIFLRTICLSIIFAFFYSQSSKSGELILASSVILLQFLNWMSYGIDGFAFAAESLTGKYVGASNDAMLKKTVSYSFLWGGALGLLYTLLYWLGKDDLISLFTNDADVIQITSKYYFWVIILPIIGFSSYIWDGIYVGLTAVKSMRNSMFLSFGIYFILFFLLKNSMGSQALWVTLLVFLFARGLFQTLLYLKSGKNLK
jgi:MATE family multidrug resistance protein